MFTILWERKALKSLKRIPIKDRVSINESVKKLANWPNCRNVISLTDHQYKYRLRVGRYRIFFDIEDTLL